MWTWWRDRRADDRTRAAGRLHADDWLRCHARDNPAVPSMAVPYRSIGQAFTDAMRGQIQAPGEEQSPNGLPTGPREPLIIKLAEAESDLDRIEAQRAAAKARIATLRSQLAALDAVPRPVAPDPLSALAPAHRRTR